MRIDGVLHEFTTVAGVKEDVTEIILNLKGLVVSSEEDEPVTMYVRKQGPGAVTGADIVPPAGVTVHNPTCTSRPSTRRASSRELVVERGRGYVPAVQNKASGAEIGRIPVDSIYSPVLKVTYKVEATRVEQRTDFDPPGAGRGDQELDHPERRPASAGKTLVELFGLARAQRRGRGHRDRPVAGRGRPHGVVQPPDRGLGADRAQLQLPQARGWHTVGELVARTEPDLLDIRNFGQKSIGRGQGEAARWRWP